MENKIYSNPKAARHTHLLLPLLMAALLSSCANYSGISSEKHIIQPQATEDAKSLPAEHGNWPAADWANQFGDQQLSDLIAEALKTNPSLDEARARVASAAAFSEEARAATLPKVGADYSLSRQQYSSTALVPPPYAGSWQTENKAVLSATYDLDLWGKNSQALTASVSKLRAAEAESEQVKLSLSSSIASVYNELARLYALRELEEDDVRQWQGVGHIAEQRIASGLDTEVERQTAINKLASSKAALTALDGQILDARYQLGALLGQGPDRGLSIRRPNLGAGDVVRLPDQLPADLVARRPDIVAARWRVDVTTHDIKSSKANFYPNINLSAAIGLDAFGFGRFLSAASRTVQVGPAIHLPIFDGGALRAKLKVSYADFDLAVANYNRTLVAALSDVATQLSRIRSNDAQQTDAQVAVQAADRAYQLAASQYKAGLTTQLTVYQARINALSSQQNLINLRMNRRTQQIALAAALGGGFVDTHNAALIAASDSSPRKSR
ncbi:efflux transporter, outer membrane factor (OMF) lipoprotein, NodT family [Collimonas sp. OK307]|uniref:efflux transporter outer membrane subunit n=1 Tax=Collimonas sp. OK307 TaxID=1801620 RepID=UPI0008EBE7B1|nr:efflux transporter outer membrane subunit [Collimonas sp. OK307]SFI32451.1 efflux transporter, outer membrane factor (OMF) lipoprotein, NodT family [Collimonas sp. OK307]